MTDPYATPTPPPQDPYGYPPAQPYPAQPYPPVQPYPPAQPYPSSAPPAYPPAQPYPASSPPYQTSTPPAYPAYPPASAPPAAGYPTSAPPTYGAPYPPPAANLPAPTSGLSGAPEPALLAIGDIQVSKNYVTVPTGRFPLRGTSWAVQDSTQETEKIATWAVVLAIVGFFCLTFFSLLFLLVKEKKVTGFIQITVTGEGLYHSVQLPPGPANLAAANNAVNQARSLAAAAY